MTDMPLWLRDLAEGESREGREFPMALLNERVTRAVHGGIEALFDAEKTDPNRGFGIEGYGHDAAKHRYWIRLADSAGNPADGTLEPETAGRLGRDRALEELVLRAFFFYVQQHPNAFESTVERKLRQELAAKTSPWKPGPGQASTGELRTPAAPRSRYRV